jgi:4-amino-4-deoxy-L-arabinose transferase-like glycosyltransferase
MKRLQRPWALGNKAVFFGLAGLAIKLTIYFQLKDHILLKPWAVLDSAAYLELADRVVRGDLLLGPGMYYLSPLYIYFIAIVLRLTHAIDAIRLVQVLFGAVSVGVVFTATREWFGSRAAWISAALLCTCGLLTFYEIVVFQSAIDAPLTAVVLLCLTYALRRPGISWALSSGAMLGIATLNRPNFVVAALLVVLTAVLFRRVKLAVLLMAGLILGMAPSVARNAYVTHKLSFVSSHGGLNFLIGNGDGANGLYRVIPGVRPSIDGQRLDTRTVAERALGRSLTDAEVSNYFASQAFNWILSHPAQWLRLMAVKFRYVLNAQQFALPLSYPFFAYDAKSFLRYLPVGPGLLLPIGLFGWLVAVRKARQGGQTDVLIWASFAPAYATAVAVFFVAERYRIPLMVALTILSGAGIDAMWSWATTRQFRQLLVASGVVSCLIIACNWPLEILDGDGRAEERVHMAENLAALGDVAGAESWLSRAKPEYPYPDVAEYRVGSRLLGSGHRQAAIPHLKAAISPTSIGASASVDLVNALVSGGDSPAALDVLEQLTSMGGRSSEQSLDLGRAAMTAKSPKYARTFFEEAVNAEPGNISAHGQLGACLLSLGEFASAASVFAAATQLAPNDATLWAGLAVSEFQLHDIAAATAHTARALALDPAQPLALEIRALLRR